VSKPFWRVNLGKLSRGQSSELQDVVKLDFVVELTDALSAAINEYYNQKRSKTFVNVQNVHNFRNFSSAKGAAWEGCAPRPRSWPPLL